MVINHDRNVGVGVVTPLDRLQVAGDVRVGTAGTNGCLKNFSGGMIIGSCSSDIRFKRDVTAFEPSLDRVAALRPVHHFWRAEAFPEKGFGPDRAYGLIAQEVEAVLPELVTTDALGYRAVDYSKLPLLAIQAIKELKEKNDTLEQRLAALEDQAGVDHQIDHPVDQQIDLQIQPIAALDRHITKSGNHQIRRI